MVAGLACIFLYKRPVLQDKCQSGLTEGTVWDNTLAMAPVLIHASKEPDGEVKVSVQILFLEWGVCSLSLWSSPDLSASTSHSHAGGGARSFLPCFYQIQSQGTSYKINSTHQDWVPGDPFGPVLHWWVKPHRLIAWFRNQRFKIVRLMKTAAGLIWVLFLNQQSCPETLDKQRLSFCLGCGAERYVLSGDCAPRPPLILRGRTHTERPCEERRGLGGHAEGGSRHAAGATHSDPSTHTQLSTTACCVIVVYKVIMTIWICIRVFWFLFIIPEAEGRLAPDCSRSS